MVRRQPETASVHEHLAGADAHLLRAESESVPGQRFRLRDASKLVIALATEQQQPDLSLAGAHL